MRAEIAFPEKPNQNNVLSYPLFLEAKGRMSFFEVREGFNFGMIYKNPMVLMMGVSCAMMFMMKYMVGEYSLPPHTLKIATAIPWVENPPPRKSLSRQRRA